ncbi:MAG: cytochrome c [Gammaproteobacteria bacterium]|nr:cytochrome c [Gammaproteobacteria bacterium]MDH3561380.1 cytochrome c [Gammaproteobacteria bacterium]
MKKIASVVMMSALLGLSGSVLAGDAAAGKTKAATCAGCHGVAGISANTLWPNLAGQQVGYLVKQMKAFRDGARSDPMMSPMAKPLSDADIDNLAAYYNSL